MKIAFFGTPEFAGNILSGILKYSDIQTILVVSQPDKAVGRKREPIAPPVKQVALNAGIEVLQPDIIKKNRKFHDFLKNLNLDFIVVVAYGKIIPKEILEIPKYGCINIHGSILPKYRGASPVQAAVKDGLQETGLTTMYMSEGMDEGDILKIGKVIIDNVDTSEDVFKKFIEIGPELLIQTLRGIVGGNISGTPQNVIQATYCSKISREDGEVFFQKQSRQEIYNTFRAYTPWPGIYTLFEGKRLILEEISLYIPSDDECLSGIYGEFIKISKNRYGIICADNKILVINRVKLEGKKSMDIGSFVNGNREILGYVFS